MNRHALFTRVPAAGFSGPVGLTRLVAIVLLVCVSTVEAHTISSPTDGLYRPGRYMPLRIEASSAGLIQIRGKDVQGIDWDAPSPASVIVPLMVYSDTTGELDLTVNGQPFKLPRRPMEPGAPWPAGVDEIDPPKPGEPRMLAFSDAGYVPADSWNGGRSLAQRQTLVYAAVAIMLVFGAVALVPRPRARSWVAVAASLGTCAVILALFGRPGADRMTIVVARETEHGQRFDWWTYYRAKAEREERVDWLPAMPRILVRSRGQLQQVKPVLICDASSNPTSIRFALPTEVSVGVLVMNGDESDHGRDGVELNTSRELVRYAYGRRAVVENGFMVIR